MKKLITALSLTAMMVGATLSTSAMAFEQKFAVIDMPTIFKSLPQREQIGQQLQKEFKERVEQIKAIEKKASALIEKQKRDGALMSEQQILDKKRELDSLKSEYSLASKALEEDMRTRQGEERNKLLLKIQKAVTAIAKKDKYDIILQSNAIAYINKKHDISAKVIKLVSKAK